MYYEEILKYASLLFVRGAPTRGMVWRVEWCDMAWLRAAVPQPPPQRCKNSMAGLSFIKRKRHNADGNQGYMCVEIFVDSDNEEQVVRNPLPHMVSCPVPGIGSSWNW